MNASLESLPQISDRQRDLLANPYAQIDGRRIYSDQEIDETIALVERIKVIVRKQALENTRDALDSA